MTAMVMLAVTTVPVQAEEGKDGEPTQTITGEIQKHSMIGSLGLGFSGSFNGIEFKLKEYPNLVFRRHTEFFDDPALQGFISVKGGKVTFLKAKGKRVEVSCVPEKSNVLKVISVTWLDANKH